MYLKKVKEHLKECGFSIMKDFLKEKDMDESEYVVMCSNICAVVYKVENIETWDDLTDMIGDDDLGILGYTSLQELMDDSIEEQKVITYSGSDLHVR